MIGLGSIGQRQARILREMGHQVRAVSRRHSSDSSVCSTLAAGLDTAPDYVVIASSTDEHYRDLQALATAGFAGQVLVEKPLFDAPREPQLFGFSGLHVAYNLRYHPLITALREALDGKQICAVQAYVGQYLPDWRPGMDYRNSYSSHADQGGGVLRDLSHELDYLLWIFGDWTELTARMGSFSQLEIDSDDVFAALFATDRCPVGTVQMNYLDQVGRREITVNTTTGTLRADMVSNTLWADGLEVRHPPLDRDFAYRAMHVDVLTGAPINACTYLQGLAATEMIAAGIKSSSNKSWISR